MWKEFREFAIKGNAIDLAVGVIIGAAFGRIVSSIVDDLLMPPLGLLLGGMDFSNWFINLSSGDYKTLAAASAAGAADLEHRLVHQRTDPVPDRGRGGLLLHREADERAQETDRRGDAAIA